MKVEKQITYKTSLPNGETITASSEEELKKLYVSKTRPERQEVTIEFPLVLTASDYHEFDSHQELLEEITGKKISYKEFDGDENDASYVAVFWIGEAEPKEEIKKAIKKFNTP